MKKNRVLWVEDAAFTDFSHYAAPFYVNGEFDLIVAEDISQAILRLTQSQFAALIVDIRLPPGEEEEWIDLYSKLGVNVVAARLGIQFLRTVLGKEEAVVQLANPISWLKPSMIGIFTVESEQEFGKDLADLGITIYEQKTTRSPDTVLLDIATRIIGR